MIQIPWNDAQIYAFKTHYLQSSRQHFFFWILSYFLKRLILPKTLLWHSWIVSLLLPPIKLNFQEIPENPRKFFSKFIYFSLRSSWGKKFFKSQATALKAQNYSLLDCKLKISNSFSDLHLILWLIPSHFYTSRILKFVRNLSPKTLKKSFSFFDSNFKTRKFDFWKKLSFSRKIFRLIFFTLSTEEKIFLIEILKLKQFWLTFQNIFLLKDFINGKQLFTISRKGFLWKRKAEFRTMISDFIFLFLSIGINPSIKHWITLISNLIHRLYVLIV